MQRDLRTEELYMRINDLFDEVVSLRVQIAKRDDAINADISEVVQENGILRERLKDANHEILKRGVRIQDLEDQIERMDKGAAK